jgi:hypothetical protein
MPSAFSGSDLLYFAVCSMFIEALKKIAPKRARVIQRYFARGCLCLNRILDNGELKDAVDFAMGANSDYRTALFIGPPGGMGDLWEDRFDQFSSLVLQSYYYGESAHGPLVTVDPDVANKFVRLEPRNSMVPEYGIETVVEWEKRYLNGRSTDIFLNQSTDYIVCQPETPFFAEGTWYFPVLKKSYDTTEDNLVILDATSRRSLPRAQDDLSTFGARYARIVVVSQEAFFGSDEKSCIFKFPISHMIQLPPMYREGKKSEPFAGLLLPIATSCISMAMAAART